MHARSRSLRRAVLVAALAALSIVPLGAHAEEGDARGDDRVQEGCEIPGSRNGLGDTLSIVSRVTCG